MAYAVLTRDATGAQPYTAALAELGLDVVPMPVTHTAPASEPEALRRALAAGGHDAVIVMSPRAAAELARARDEAIVELPTGWAVGEATQRALVAARIPALHPAGVRDGAELARRLAATNPRRVLAPRAEEGRDDAVVILRAAGAVVDDVIAYRTLPLPASDARPSRGLALLVATRVVVVVAFAPSQVAALVALLRTRGVTLSATRAALVAIGETTAAAMRKATIADVAVADAPTPEGIAKAVASVYRSPS